MPLEFWIIGVGLVVLAICIWRIAAWYQRNPGTVKRRPTSPLYRQTQAARFMFTAAAMFAVVLAVIATQNLPWWAGVIVAVGGAAVVGGVNSAITTRMWRCPQCGAGLPRRWSRSGGGPQNVDSCPNCGEVLVTEDASPRDSYRDMRRINLIRFGGLVVLSLLCGVGGLVYGPPWLVWASAAAATAFFAYWCWAFATRNSQCTECQYATPCPHREFLR